MKIKLTLLKLTADNIFKFSSTDMKFNIEKNISMRDLNEIIYKSII